MASFVVKHAGLGGENTGWNTGAFTIETSTDNATLTTAVGQRLPGQPHLPPDRRARRALRPADHHHPANNGNTAARIYELEVYAGGGGPVNVALRTAATADSSCGANEGPDKAVNGSGWPAGNTDKWCSLGASKFWRVDLGSAFTSSSIGPPRRRRR